METSIVSVKIQTHQISLSCALLYLLKTEMMVQGNECWNVQVLKASSERSSHRIFVDILFSPMFYQDHCGRSFRAFEVVSCVEWNMYLHSVERGLKIAGECEARQVCVATYFCNYCRMVTFQIC